MGGVLLRFPTQVSTVFFWGGGKTITMAHTRIGRMGKEEEGREREKGRILLENTHDARGFWTTGMGSNKLSPHPKRVPPLRNDVKKG